MTDENGWPDFSLFPDPATMADEDVELEIYCSIVNLMHACGFHWEGGSDYFLGVLERTVPRASAEWERKNCEDPWPPDFVSVFTDALMAELKAEAGMTLH